MKVSFSSFSVLSHEKDLRAGCGESVDHVTFTVLNTLIYYSDSFFIEMYDSQDEYVTMSPVVLINSPTSHSDERSDVNDPDRSTQNTEAVTDVDLHHTDAPALTEGLDLDQIYTKTDADSVQESIYQIVDQTSE